MKNPIVLRLLLTVFCCTTIAYGQDFSEPGLEFVCELKVTTSETKVVGKTAHGERRIIPITGGTFEGPEIRGTVLSGGADYQYVNAKNDRTEIEAIYSIETHDGVIIHIRNEGLVFKTPEMVLKMQEDGPFDWNNVYFRAAPKFEAPVDSNYNWLNNAIFVCKGVPAKEYVSIQVWKVL